MKELIKMKKIVVTGGSGLIGHEVMEQLKNDWSIYAVVRCPNEELSQKARLIISDLSRGCDDTSSFPKTVDAVVHLAQSDHFREFPEMAEDVFNVNTLTTLRLLEYARKAGAKTFIYATSGGVYGYGEEEFSENQPIVVSRDLGFYVGTKLCSEIIAENYAPYMNVILLRFFFVYGPRQKETMLIPRLIRNVKDGRPIQLQGRNGIRINPTFVSDAANAVVRSLELMDSQKINVGGPDVLTLRQIGEIIGETVGRQPIFETQEEIKSRDLIGDIHKMSQLLIKPKTGFCEGIRLMTEQSY